MLENLFTEKDVAEFRSWLEWADRFVIISHMSPDGDAVGSSLALMHYLQSRDKTVSVVMPDGIPDFLKWLPGADSIISFENKPDKAELLMFQADVICCLDFNAPNRVAAAAEALLGSKARKIMIDHHPGPSDFCNITLSRPEASSASELVFMFLCAFGEYRNMSLQTAECIYTGMMTDTGAFTYNSSQSQIFYIISQLIEKGIDKDEIYRRVYNNYSADRFRLMGYVLSEKMQVFPEWSAALITLSQEEQDRYNFQKGDTEGFVNIPLQISGIRFSVFMREDREKGYIKISLRSVGDVPSNQFAARHFNGGGHRNASGGEFHGTLKEAEQEFLEGMQNWEIIQK